MNNTHSIEILAPAGGQEQLIAAVRCGADAVYLGAKGFNARRNAENFDSLAEAVTYCHARNVRVYVTVNTLVTDDELPAAHDTLREIADSGADAVIVQDLAIANMVRTHCPDLELHASTQMTVHNAAGAQMLESHGFARVVLARELTLAEIAEIRAQSGIALEAFVHGALCVSASGACYLSSILGGRSGNRGLCAQPCRLDFSSGARPFALSLKDLSALGQIDALRAAGISALKIEGRMKRPEYVAAAVTACRQAIRGEPYDLETLKAVFSRSGFTDGYPRGKRNLAMFGVRAQEDVDASRRVQGGLRALYRREYLSVPVDMALVLHADAASTLTVSDGAHSLTVDGPAAEAALSVPTDEARAARSLSKTGESPFLLRSLHVANDGGWMLPAATLNAMRRDAMEQLLALRETATPKPFLDTPPPVYPAHQAAATPATRLRFESATQLWDDDMDAEQIILPIESITATHLTRFGNRLVAELPALIFPKEEHNLTKALQDLRDGGLNGALCNNLGAIRMALNAGLMPHGGYGLNILNSAALGAYASMGLVDATVSFELHAKKIRRLGGTLPRGALAYGLLPLMQLRCCPAQGPNGCGACDGSPTLTDRTGVSFPLRCHHRRYVTLLNSVPLNLSGEPLAGIDFQTLHFTNETAAECRRILESFMLGHMPEGRRTRGLYHRTLQ